MRLAGFLCLLFATAAYGIDLGKADIDGDGRVSKAEAAGNAELMAIFDRADRDRNGRLTSEEIEAFQKRKPRASASAGGTAKAKKKAAKD